MLAAGRHANGREANGRSALHYAAGHGAKDALDELLNAGASAALVDNTGLGALGMAAMKSRPAVIEALLDAGADPLLPAKAGTLTGKTAVDMARLVGSDECASVDGTRYAPSPCAFSSERKPESFIVGSAGWNSLHSGTPGRKQHGQLSSSGGRPRFLPKEILSISAKARRSTREASFTPDFGACCEQRSREKSLEIRPACALYLRTLRQHRQHIRRVEVRGNPWNSHG